MSITGTPTEIAASVATPAALAGLPDEGYKDGDWAYVVSTKKTYRLDRASVAVADGTLVIATFTTHGRWLEFLGGAAGLTPFTGTGVSGNVVIAAPVNLEGVNDYDNLTIDAGVVVTVPNDGYLILRARQSIVVNGTIDADGVNGTTLSTLDQFDFAGRVMGSQGGSGGGGGGGGGGGAGCVAGTGGTSGLGPGRNGYTAGTAAFAGGPGGANGGAPPVIGADGGQGFTGSIGIMTANFGDRLLIPMIFGGLLIAGGAMGYNGGAGGAGGAGATGAAGGAGGAGGVGGRGGGLVILIAPSITIGAAGSILARGLAGAVGAVGAVGTANAGGGGGGGGGGSGGGGGCGGLVALYYQTISNLGTINVTGGVGGAATLGGVGGASVNGKGGDGGPGAVGTAGSAGILVSQQIFTA